jgi:hypothetical protein
MQEASFRQECVLFEPDVDKDHGRQNPGERPGPAALEQQQANVTQKQKAGQRQQGNGISLNQAYKDQTGQQKNG